MQLEYLSIPTYHANHVDVVTHLRNRYDNLLVRITTATTTTLYVISCSRYTHHCHSTPHIIAHVVITIIISNGNAITVTAIISFTTQSSRNDTNLCRQQVLQYKYIFINTNIQIITELATFL